MRWYYAHSEGAERWDLGGESREAAISEGRGTFGGDPFVIAPEAAGQTDAAFYAALAEAIAGGFVDVDEILGENGWVDFEDGWLEGARAKNLERALAGWLPTVIARPDWRTVDTSKAERIEEVDDD